ncbi:MULTISPECIES: hypothetical protein [unclassified Nocardioides]|uniref:hypothetical protein n=1 Tax=unclassified Nocardioides TaxID=2615069 RepID=UPI000702F9B6|nr:MULTISPECIES: hypothetical protein [unclassified Nocardioides]KRC46469.1 hypothetical protein ASE19_21860 [Nocardioides sp. Root79]KRC69813.1 hypothetical protein ASE20_14710 [Nocardioides sp. Root240]
MSITEANAYPVELEAGDSANGVSSIVGTLLGQNFENFPERVRFAKRTSRPVAVYSTDTEQACTIMFRGHGAIVHDGLIGRPAVTVRASVDQILDVSQLKMKRGGLVPVGFFTKRGMSVLGQILRRKLVVKGLLTHPITALRFIALVSVV